jgi:hyperosmotically inducible protein
MIQALSRLMFFVTLSLLSSGCQKQETTSAPPGGPPPGAPMGGPGGPPGGLSTPPPGTAAQKQPGGGSDAVMASKVKNALITSKVNATSVDVDAQGGVVTLNGSVPTAGQKALAEKAARQVTGVTTVKDNLTVGAK